MTGQRVKEWAIGQGASERDADFIEKLLIAHRTGDYSKVIALLERASNAPLGPFAQTALAEHFKAGVLPKKPGRPRDANVVRAARLVHRVQLEFNAGDWRIRRGQTREAAIRAALYILRREGLPVPDEQALRNYLNRPKHFRTKS